MRRALFIVLSAAVVCGWQSSSATARTPYFDAFKEKYAGDDKAYADLVAETKCFICHVGKSRKNRNDYGMALSKLLKNEKDKEKIMEALAKAESEKSPDGKTFGELIKEHKLPGGPPKKD